MAQADVALIGLAVMGQNLALNMSERGHRVAVYNRTAEVTDDFLAGPARGASIVGARSIEELVGHLAPPRIVLLMVRAGEVVDRVIDQVAPLLAEGDVIVDGGNSRHTDSTRRTRALAERGLLFVGAGVSGGEEGARHGPSIMPGGNPEAWPIVRPILQSIAARVAGEPCCEWVGEEGAGHYVKMVHNGIEYGDMQLIGEAYQLLHEGVALGADELADVFAEWNRGRLESYLVEITGEIFRAREPDGTPLVERILDTAGQKGTGKWTAIEALGLGVPLGVIGEAVFARFLSATKDERVAASKRVRGPRTRFRGDREKAITQAGDALYAAKIVSWAQGFALMRAAARENEWTIDLGTVASLWRGGCIIRSRFLGDIRRAYADRPDLDNLLLDDFFADEVRGCERGWRDTARLAIRIGVPTPALGSALAWYDAWRSARLPANLLQAQRDYFGAHAYERVDRARGEFFHTDWTGSGDETPTTTYQG